MSFDSNEVGTDSLRRPEEMRDELPASQLEPDNNEQQRKRVSASKWSHESREPR